MVEQSTQLRCRSVRDGASDYLDGLACRRDAQEFSLHFKTCPGCARFYADLQRTVFVLRELRVATPSAETTSQVLYSLRRANELTRGIWSIDTKSDYGRQWSRLCPLTAGARLEYMKEMPPERVQSFCEWLIDRSRDVVGCDPAEAVPLSETAVLYCENLPEPFRQPDFCATCYWSLSVAYLGVSNLQRAREALQSAQEWFARQPQNNRTKARLLLVESWIKSTTGCLDEAETLSREAETVFAGLGDYEYVVSTQISRSSVHLRRGEYSSAVDLLQKALPAVEETAPTRIFWSAHINLALAYCELGEVREAEALLPRLEKLARLMKGDRSLHVEWLVGTIARVKEDWRTALKIFYKLRGIFQDRRESVNYVECSLDICRIYLSKRDWPNMRLLIKETREVTQRISEEPSILTAVTLLEASVEEMTLTQAQLGAFVGLLWNRQSRAAPG